MKMCVCSGVRRRQLVQWLEHAHIQESTAHWWGVFNEEKEKENNVPVWRWWWRFSDTVVQKGESEKTGREKEKADKTLEKLSTSGENAVANSNGPLEQQMEAV